MDVTNRLSALGSSGRRESANAAVDASAYRTGEWERRTPGRSDMSLKQKVFMMWLKKRLIWIALAIVVVLAVYFLVIR